MARINVRDVMTESPFALEADADLASVYDLMETKGVRHIPIVDTERNVVGLVSHRDLVRGALNDANEMPINMRRDMLSEHKVEEIMITEPETIDLDESLRTAGEIIFENKFGCLPVVEGEKLVGILTESDFVRYTVDNLSD